MQVKKFEAPTLQEALDTIKRELGPEAIILQTKQNRRGFGLMSKGSVEVTAAVSERAIEKKSTIEKKIPESYKQKLAGSSAARQADVYDSYLEKKLERERVQISQGASQQQKKITAVRYADIDDEEAAGPRSQPAPSQPLPEYEAPPHLNHAIRDFSEAKQASSQVIQEELENLKKLVDELRREKKRAEYLDSDSPYAATDALEQAYELMIQAGMERRFAVSVMREASRSLGVEKRADHEAVLDFVAEELLRSVEIAPVFGSPVPSGQQEAHVFVGAPGSGKTALIAKLGTHAARARQEKIGIIRIQLSADDGSDPLVIFAKALHVPYRCVTSTEELAVAIQDMSQCARLFIDSSGVSPRDISGIKQLGNILSELKRARIHLVVNATVRDQELREQGRNFSALFPNSLMFTRLDETFSYGNIYSLSRHLKLPISVFSSGRKVTEQWENASGERLTASILNIL
jgi:flagellar biosynthesis protein FlhF